MCPTYAIVQGFASYNHYARGSTALAMTRYTVLMTRHIVITTRCNFPQIQVINWLTLWT
uniref:Uncharacterized protein n=1 Tax=Rhizophora mucronata TaxID=61149 RepID=A0A2P2P0W2_RHIMU